MASSQRKIISDLINQTGMRVTSQRNSILKALIENSNKHLSVDEIYDLVKEKDDFIGIATIYRTLDLLEDLGVIVKRDFRDKSAKYEFIFNEKKEHYHLICKECGRVIEISGLLPNNLKEKVMEEKDFKSVDYSLQIYGYCNKCMEKDRIIDI
jgi:Fur family ferric uptake transcriptional regulator